MRLTTNLLGSLVALVPYDTSHVPTYHRWMQDPELLAQTQSEPVRDLEAQYRVQAGWVSAPLRGAFIIYDRTQSTNAKSVGESKSNEVGKTGRSGSGSPEESNEKQEKAVLAQNPGVGSSRSPSPFGRMAGDVNFFLSSTFETNREVELSIMIAEKSCRCKGLATEALKLTMEHCVRAYGAWRFTAKIANGNLASYHLFRGKLEFCEKDYDETFNHHLLVLETPQARLARSQFDAYYSMRAPIWPYLSQQSRRLFDITGYPLPMSPHKTLSDNVINGIKKECQITLQEQCREARSRLENVIGQKEKKLSEIEKRSNGEVGSRVVSRHQVVLKRLKKRLSNQAEVQESKQAQLNEALDHFLKKFCCTPTKQKHCETKVLGEEKS